MSPRPLTPAQSAILRVLQSVSERRYGLRSAEIAANHFRGRYARWSTPKLKALAKRGLVQRDEANAERWALTPAGQAFNVGEAAS